MIEIADLLQHGLHDLGHHARIINEGLPKRTISEINIVVAPHEYYDFQAECFTNKDLTQAASHSIHLTTEQPGTKWFEKSWLYASCGPLVLDINRLGMLEQRRRGQTACYLSLGYHRSIDAWHGLSTSCRHHDVAFIGSLTPRREKLLASLSETLQPYNSFLLLSDVGKPITDDNNQYLAGQRKYEFLSSTKILLNFHRGEKPYFEWFRIVEAMANGAVILTEPSSGHEPLQAGQHFVEFKSDAELSDNLVELLSNDQYRSQIAHNAYMLLRDNLQFCDQIKKVMPDILNAQHKSPNLLLQPVKKTLGTAHHQAANVKSFCEKVQMRRARIAERQNIGQSSPAKRIAVEERKERRQVEAEKAINLYGNAKKSFVTDSASYENATPEVSVVLTAYNYCNYIAAAIHSVFASTGVAVELIVVDDASTDTTSHIMDDLLLQYKDQAIRVIRHAANQGLARARNIGFEHTRAGYVFILDADNLIYPKCLATLKHSLDSCDAAFAYSIIEKFGKQTGLVSAYGWDVNTLIWGNYIDAMSMVRKSSWREVGRFIEDLEGESEGWEDYALWLAFAERGWKGEICREILARYRTHSASMLNTITIGEEQQRDMVVCRFPALQAICESHEKVCEKTQYYKAKQALSAGDFDLANSIVKQVASRYPKALLSRHWLYLLRRLMTKNTTSY